MERPRSAGGQTSNGSNAGHEWTATPTTRTDETDISSVCAPKAGICIHGLAQPTQGQDAPPNVGNGAEGGSTPHHLGLQDGGNADTGGRMSHHASAPPTETTRTTCGGQTVHPSIRAPARQSDRTNQAKNQTQRHIIEFGAHPDHEVDGT